MDREHQRPMESPIAICYTKRKASPAARYLFADILGCAPL